MSTPPTLDEQFEVIRARDGLPADATLHDALARHWLAGTVAGAEQQHARAARVAANERGEGYCCPGCEAGDRLAALALLVDEHAEQIDADPAHGPHRPHTAEAVADGLRVLMERAMRKDHLGRLLADAVLGIKGTDSSCTTR